MIDQRPLFNNPTRLWGSDLLSLRWPDSKALAPERVRSTNAVDVDLDFGVGVKQSPAWSDMVPARTFIQSAKRRGAAGRWCDFNVDSNARDRGK